MGCCWHLRRAKPLRRSIPKGIRAMTAAAGPGPGAVPATSKATPATTATTTAMPTTRTILCTTPLCLPVELLLSNLYSKI